VPPLNGFRRKGFSSRAHLNHVFMSTQLAHKKDRGMIEEDEAEQRGRGEPLTSAGGLLGHVGAPTAQPSGAHAGPCRPSHEDAAGDGPRLVTQHPKFWGGPRAAANLAHAVGKPRCTRIACTPLAPFTYPNTRRLPPHLTQANTSKSNVLLSSCAQMGRGGRS
jgi:hypothetical protein